MSDISRRRFVQAAGAAAALGTLAGFGRLGFAAAGKRVVVVGGGYGGAVAAKYLKRGDGSLDVTLIDANAEFVSCPMSNEVLSGERDLASITFDYGTLQSRHGVRFVHDAVVALDPDKHLVRTAGGTSYPYDKLVLSPGIDFRYDAIAGYGAEVAEQIPHAWKAGPQTTLLRRQLEAMPDGGVCYIVAPPNPFRCPPGPYERAAQIAHYFQHHKPRSKVIILDAKDRFSKQGLFQQGWKHFYGDRVEWVSGAAGGIVEGIDPARRTLIGQVDEYKGDVLNVIPPQKAAAIAAESGLTDDSGWCPVDPKTFQSTLHPDVHVIGDACIAGAMPKSGYAANSQAKVAAAAILAALAGEEAPEPSYVNTCYSIIAPEWGISVAAVYELKDGKIQSVEGAGGLSPADAKPELRAVEARYARSWFTNITADTFT